MSTLQIFSIPNPGLPVINDPLRRKYDPHIAVGHHLGIPVKGPVAIGHDRHARKNVLADMDGIIQHADWHGHGHRRAGIAHMAVEIPVSIQQAESLPNLTG